MVCLQIVAFCPFENFRPSHQYILLLTDVVKHRTMTNLLRLYSTTRWPFVGMVTNNHFRSCQAMEICIDLTTAHYLNSTNDAILPVRRLGTPSDTVIYQGECFMQNILNRP